MSALAQNLIVLLAVGAAAGFVGWQALRKLAGKKTTGCGQCGGCGTQQNQQRTEPPAAKSGGGVAFLPVGNLRASKRLAK